MEQAQYLLSRDLSQRLAAIDIGTNSIRLIVAEALRDGQYRVLDEEKETTRLGRSLAKTGKMDEESIQQSLDTLRRMKQIADGYQVSELKAIATCAVREAENGEEFCRRAMVETGVKVTVISAEREAHLAFYSVSRAFDLAEKRVALADIGGGSTEIVLSSGKVIEAVYTTKLGTVRLAEKFGGNQTLTGRNFIRLVHHVDKQLKKQSGKPVFVPHVLIGSGGTFTSLATMMMAIKGQAGLPVQGYQVTHADVRHLLDRLVKMTVKERRSMPGLSPDRADIIVPGITIIDRLLRWFQVNQVQVHHRGVRDGLVLTMIDRINGRPEQREVNRDAAVDQFAVQCGSDLLHERHVAFLASRIYRQLAEKLDIQNDNDLTLLETAAKLQDVGYLINYDSHHKHSYHLILNSRLPGFRPRELEMIANVARYHRGSLPKKKHANFRQLSRHDQLRVRRMAAVLRIAGGLDRSHTQNIADAYVHQADDVVDILVDSQQFPEVDLWGARRRVELFEKTFGKAVTIRWQGPDSELQEDHNNGVTNAVQNTQQAHRGSGPSN